MTADEPAGPEEVEAGDGGAGPDLAAPDRVAVEPLRAGSTAFWRALALAVLLHGAMLLPLVGLPGNASLQRRLGEADGDPNAINVDVIEAGAMPAAAAPPSPPPAPPPSEPPPPIVMEEPPPPTPPVPQQEPPAKEPPPKEATKQASPPPPETAEKQDRPPAGIRGTTDPDGPVAEPPVPVADPAATKKAAQTAALMNEMTEMFAPGPPRQNAPQPRERPNPAQPSETSAGPSAGPSVLDTQTQFQGNSSSFARPVDITRSGENDEFGRGVIRALRQTMPSPWGLKARVTIKFYLSPSGQVAEMRLMQGSGYPLVDQSVVFAARNSTFPRPPPGSKISDRVFLVTYIYE